MDTIEGGTGSSGWWVEEQRMSVVCHAMKNLLHLLNRQL